MYAAFGCVPFGPDPSVHRSQEPRHQPLEIRLTDGLLLLERSLSDLGGEAFCVEDEVLQLGLGYSSLKYALFESLRNSLQLPIPLIRGRPQRRPDVGLGIAEDRIEASDRTPQRGGCAARGHPGFAPRWCPERGS